MSEAGGMVVLGRVAGVFGVKGWVKVFSHTEPRENILQYAPWYLAADAGWRECRPLEGKVHGKGIVARIEYCDDRDQAAALVGCDIAVRRSQLPPPEPGEYYWSDLEGLDVVTRGGVVLGSVSHLFSTGANDVMVVNGDRERLIPWLLDDVVLEVDLRTGVVRVDWDPDF